MFCIWKGLSCSLICLFVFSFLSFSQNPIVTENAFPEIRIPNGEFLISGTIELPGFATKMSLNRGSDRAV